MTFSLGSKILTFQGHLLTSFPRVQVSKKVFRIHLPLAAEMQRYNMTVFGLQCVLCLVMETGSF
jgi:hypothetical protein